MLIFNKFMWKKIVALGILLSGALLLAINWLLSSAQLERITNHFLDSNFSLQIVQKPDIGAKNGVIPSLILNLNQGGSCQLAHLRNVRLNWWGEKTLSV
ncbi:MAG TPA: hypothetical protein DD638_03625, partial [Pasteurellaceae bacterium]|nr:hypothetical protein [Pasteurellaceae bacterium]